jgi:hypothetical protein
MNALKKAFAVEIGVSEKFFGRGRGKTWYALFEDCPRGISGVGGAAAFCLVVLTSH